MNGTSRDALYVGDYNSEMDKFTECSRVELRDITALQIGPGPAEPSWSIRKDNAAKGPTLLRVLCSKVHLSLDANHVSDATPRCRMGQRLQ